MTASVRRNGGTTDETHLCDACLTVGLRALKVEIDARLVELDAEGELVHELTQRLAHTQHVYEVLRHDHNRMQQRLMAFLAHVDGVGLMADGEIEMVRYEATRPKAKALSELGV